MRFEDRVKALFDSVVSHPASDWERLVSECVHEDAVKAEVRRLLEHHAKTTDFLSKPAVEAYPVMIREAGAQLGKFTIIRKINPGGMSIVYLAHDRSDLDRQVALKVMSTGGLSQEQAERRFRIETEAANLSHPGIVKVFESGEVEGIYYIAMEFVEGETLDARLKRMRKTGLPPAPPAAPKGEKHRSRSQTEDPPADPRTQYINEVLRIVAAVADALEYAHQYSDTKKSVIHRDVKPSNILLDKDGVPRLTDFGIAKIMDAPSSTMSGETPGSCHYMSAEQVRAHRGRLDHRTDVYSLGVVLYECLTLRLPFTGATIDEVFEKIKAADPIPIQRLNPAVSDQLTTYCNKAMEKEPGDRFPTAAHFAAELRCCLRGDEGMTKPPGFWRRAKKFVIKHRVGVVAGCVALLSLLSVGLGYGLWTAHQRTLGGISIALGTDVNGAVVHAQRLNESGQRTGEVVRLGSAPVGDVRVASGLYRFSITADGDNFAEFDDYLFPGVIVQRQVWLRPTESVSEGMVRFDAGLYGCTAKKLRNGEPEPAQVPIPEMLMDEAEVSNAEYKAFVDATGHAVPESWRIIPYTSSMGDLPVVGVTQSDATAFALWKGKRLPTHLEWMALAQSPDGRLLPWGAQPAPASAVPSEGALREEQKLTEVGVIETYLRRTRKVRDGDATRTPKGLYHMFGNVGEYTGTVFSYSRDPGSPGSPSIVVADTNWLSDPVYTNLTLVGFIRYLDRGSPRIGFRCVRSVRPTIVAQ